MKNLIYLSLIALFVNAEIRAQTPKVAFVGITRSSSSDGFSFVLGEDLAGGTVIYFTDEEYRNGCDDFSPDGSCAPPGEPYVVYTVPAGGLSEGDVVSITEQASTANNFDVNPPGFGSALIGGSGAFSTSSSDAFYAFDTDTPSDPLNNVTQIYAAITFSGPWDGVINTGEDPTPDHPTAVVFIAGGNDREYNPTLRSSATVNKSDITNSSNWVNATAGSPSTTPFTGMINLPVQLEYFDVKTDNKEVDLSWQTASETNNDYFQIEHSTDGRTFEGLGKVAGQGTTQNTTYYTYRDVRPAPGTNYYRLKQVDYDGTFAYSDIRVVHFDAVSATTIAVSPNPFTDQIRLNVSELAEEDIATIVTIKNVHGQIIHQEALKTTSDYSLDLSDLAAGTYFLQVQQAGQTIDTQRLVKI